MNLLIEVESKKAHQVVSSPTTTDTIMTPRLGTATILSTAIACLVGLVVYVVGWSKPRSVECVANKWGMKGLERIGPSGEHQWFDGQCWTTTPQPPRDMPISPLFRTPPGPPKPLPPPR